MPVGVYSRCEDVVALRAHAEVFALSRHCVGDLGHRAALSSTKQVEILQGPWVLTIQSGIGTYCRMESGLPLTRVVCCVARSDADAAYARAGSEW